MSRRALKILLLAGLATSGTSSAPAAEVHQPANSVAPSPATGLAQTIFPRAVMLGQPERAFASLIRRLAAQPGSRLQAIEARDPGFLDALITRTAPLYLVDVEPSLPPLWDRTSQRLQKLLTEREVARSLIFYRSPAGVQLRNEIARLARVREDSPTADAEAIARGASDLGARAYARLSPADRKVADAYLREFAGEHRDVQLALAEVQLEWLRQLPPPRLSQSFKDAITNLIRERGSLQK